MHPILDTMFYVAAAAVVAVGAITVLPRPKPEPPPVEQTVPCDPQKEICPNPAVRAEPLTEEERLLQLEKNLANVAQEQKTLAKEIKALAVEQGQKEK